MCPHFISNRNCCRLNWEKPSQLNHCMSNEYEWLDSCVIFNDKVKNPTLNGDRERAENQRKEQKRIREEKERQEWLKTEEGQKWVAEEREAFEKLVKFAEQNDTKALYELGKKYLDGNNEIGIKKDNAKAIECIKKAAKQGNIDANNFLIKIKKNKQNAFIRYILGIIFGGILGMLAFTGFLNNSIFFIGAIISVITGIIIINISANRENIKEGIFTGLVKGAVIYSIVIPIITIIFGGGFSSIIQSIFLGAIVGVIVGAILGLFGAIFRKIK